MELCSVSMSILGQAASLGSVTKAAWHASSIGRLGGFKLHPTWYVPLQPDASDDEIQRLLYQLGQGSCLRPCAEGEEAG